MKGKFDELINSDTPVLIDFYADWCGPCKMLSPVVQEVAKELSGKIKVVKIDVDKNQNISTRYGIQSIPTLMIFKNGQAVWRQAGVVGKQQILDSAVQFA
ncbi:MAG: thioredoxin [Bacteroidota bacterium]